MICTTEVGSLLPTSNAYFKLEQGRDGVCHFSAIFFASTFCDLYSAAPARASLILSGRGWHGSGRHPGIKVYSTILIDTKTE
jgi:hypothetical protein